MTDVLLLILKINMKKKNKQDKKYTVTCEHCLTVLVFEEYEANDNQDGELFITCPNCEHFVFTDKDEYEKT
jgi:RNase P subunit RPR2